GRRLAALRCVRHVAEGVPRRGRRRMGSADPRRLPRDVRFSRETVMRIHHLALRTHDLSRLVAFYVDLLGFGVARRQEDRSVWLDAGDAILMLERADEGETITTPTMELVAFAIRPEEHAIYTERLERAGVAIEGATASTVYFRDPDGRRIGLSA